MAIELFETLNDNGKLITSPKVDGEHALIMREFISSNDGPDVEANVFKNAYKALPLFTNPNYSNNEKYNLSKILAVGRVQSGKTSFFISTAALAFDNGYDLVYLIGGTKNTLRDQNYNRVSDYFANDKDVEIYDINKVESETIEKKLNLGYKVILVVLKNSAENANLGRACQIAHEFERVPSLVIDDEGDEYTPGAPKLKHINNRIGANHDLIQEVIYSICHCTYLSVTATPQANFLIDTFDAVSPDYAILVEPGEEYTGGNSFHDTSDNPHVTEILDTDDFKQSIPDSFIDALNFFIFACALKRVSDDTKIYSMLVHPSSLTRVQRAIADKINERIETIKGILSDKTNIAYQSTVNGIMKQEQEYLKINSEADISNIRDSIRNNIYSVAHNLSIYQFNITESGRADMEKEKTENALYRIYVGGNMLGRGLTIKNLCVTYMYRDSKTPAVDTLYQRARWLGYKLKYFDICRVFMTGSLKEQFMAVVDSENDMWEALRNFLETKINVKQFPRYFSLTDPSEKMILTRKSVSNTVVVQRINPGFVYDKTVWFNEDGKQSNKVLYTNYLNKHLSDSEPVCFTKNSDYQTHLIVKTTLINFYNEFLSSYCYPRGSKFGDLGFKKMLRQVSNGEIDDELYVIIMRYKSNEFRSLISEEARVIKELPNSYNADYCGDKNLTGYANKMHIQIHLVYTDEKKPEDIMPLMALNNPLSKKSIRYVTGDNVYDTI